MKPIKTWIVLASAKGARIIEYAGPGKGLVQVEAHEFEIGENEGHSDQQGRVFRSFSHSRHKLEGHARPQAELTRSFDDLFSKLDASLQSGAFSRLIVCASPQTLGMLRDRLPNRLQEVTVSEIPKDLTQVRTQDLSGYFQEILVT